MLYLDRAFLSATDERGVWWVYYVGLSELMLKSYVLPAALMSVLFPWTVRVLGVSPDRVGGLYLKKIVPACLGMGLLAAVLASVVPIGVLARIGMPADLSGDARLIAATFAAFTLMNWSSQGLIGLLQVTGSMRWVASTQVLLLGPFLAALSIASLTNSVLALVAVWALRIMIFWSLLVYRARTDLRALSDSS